MSSQFYAVPDSLLFEQVNTWLVYQMKKSYFPQKGSQKLFFSSGKNYFSESQCFIFYLIVKFLLFVFLSG